MIELKHLDIDMTTSNKLLTPAEAASALNIAPTTIRLWAKDGKIPFTTTLGGHRRFKVGDIERLLNKPVQNHNVKILIVEDDEELGQIMLKLLALYLPEYEFLLAKDGFEAGGLIHTFKPNIILLDIFIPHEDGFSICKRIKDNNDTSHISIIAITGEYTESNIEKISSLGASYCLAKPIDYILLVKFITLLAQTYSASNSLVFGEVASRVQPTTQGTASVVLRVASLGWVARL
jgi:excisionase family DNA binding protein